MLDDIFKDSSQVKKMIEKYGKERQNAESDLKMLIYNNYKTFISLSDNIHSVQNSFGSLKKQFSQYDDILNSLENLLVEEKKGFSTMKKREGLFERELDDDIDDEDLIEKIKKRKEVLDIPSPIKKFSKSVSNKQTCDRFPQYTS